MRTVATIATMLVRLTGLLQLVLGIVFWTGRARSLVPLHILIGLVLVLSLWALALPALQRRVVVSMALVAFVLGGIVVIFGLLQTVLLTGDFHWLIRAVHLLLGLAAIGLAEVLYQRLRRA